METNLSANTLFHFTSTKQNLLGILSNGLYSRYTLENFESIISGKSELVFPMVCFCDIPLSQVKRHTKTYGNYAIGLSKNWGMKNKINPVIYTYRDSAIADILNKLINEIDMFIDIDDDYKNNKLKKKNESLIRELYFILEKTSYKHKEKIANRIIEMNENFAHIIKYIKPYEGKFYRENRYFENPVKFYEEREWRFIPQKEIFNQAKKIKDSYDAEYYKDPIKRRAINIKLAKYSKLTFEANDIRFIIVNSDDEIPAILKEIEEIFGKKASYNDLKLLGTRLISLKQIIDDF